MSEVFAAGEVPRKLVEFKDSWYALAQKCEGLSEYKSGLDEGFGSALTSILQAIRDLDDLLDNISVATQMHIPSKRDEVEEIRAAFMASLRELEGEIDGGLKMLGRYAELSPRLDEVSKNLRSLRERHDDFKKHATRTCDHYSRMKGEYEQRINNIRAATDRELEKIKSRFISELNSTFEGYCIVSKSHQEELALDLLLERLIQDPNYYQKVDVVHRGLFGRKRSDIEARLVLLQYKAAEISKAIRPVLDEEKKRISKFEGEGKRVSDLGIQCRELREEEKALFSKRESLEKDVGEVEIEIGNIRARFGNYAKLADLVDSYVKKFGETTHFRNKLSGIIESSFAAYEPVEKDVEKRELMEEVKTLRGRLAPLESERKKLKKDLGNANKLVKENEKKIKNLTKELEKTRSEAKDLGGKLSSVTVEKKSLKKELSKTMREKDSIEKHLKEKEIATHIKTAESAERKKAASSKRKTDAKKYAGKYYKKAPRRRKR
ncbi:MAG: hypothetical protein ACE5G7_03040 [Candidatus Hydrothermarchaeaceae archaeon]